MSRASCTAIDYKSTHIPYTSTTSNHSSTSIPRAAYRKTDDCLLDVYGRQDVYDVLSQDIDTTTYLFPTTNKPWSRTTPVSSTRRRAVRIKSRIKAKVVTRVRKRLLFITRTSSGRSKNKTIHKTKTISSTVNGTTNVHTHIYKSHGRLSARYDSGMLEETAHYRSVIRPTGCRCCFNILRRDAGCATPLSSATLTDDGLA